MKVATTPAPRGALTRNTCPNGSYTKPLGFAKSTIAALAVSLLGLTCSEAVPVWGTPIMQPGIAAATCNVDTSLPPAVSYVFGLVDTRNPSAVDYGPSGTFAPLWKPTMYHNPLWNVTMMGNVFGITIDSDGDIYVAAHGLYSMSYGGFNYYNRYGTIGGWPTANPLAAAGTIYKVDRLTEAVTVFAVLPQQAMPIHPGFTAGPGIGNLCYDSVNDQFFATNLEDGKIYRISNAGVVIDNFDPLVADTGAVGMPASSGERLWGIGVSGNAVHYAVWNTGTSTNPCKIRRVNLTGAGAFITGSDAEILVVPFTTKATSSAYTPVSDITFSQDGTRMVMAERTMLSETTSYNHDSRVHIAVKTGAVWSVTRTLETGKSWGVGECYGGVAYGYEGGAAEQIIWASSADMATSAGPHGLFGVRPGDFPVAPPTPGSGTAANAYRIPYDYSWTVNGPQYSNYTLDWKGSGGDVEIMQDDKCMEIKTEKIDCPDAITSPFVVTLTVTNNSPNTAVYGWLTPCPAASLPPGAVTVQPTPISVFTLATPIPGNGGTGTVTVNLPLTLSGKKVCFRLTLLNATGGECCTEKICVDLPKCDCAELIDHAVTCAVQADGTIKYTITLTIKNRSNLGPNPFSFAYANFLPPLGFSPATVTPTPNPIPPGGTGTVTTCYYGTPHLLCFDLSVHDVNIEDCCTIEKICIDLPDCPGGGDKPDTCELTHLAPCCPSPVLPFPTATVTFTVCNNSLVPRTYSWNAAGFVSPTCAKLLPAAAFSPSSGSLGPIAPGSCASVTVTIRCEGFVPGECANYRFCASYSAAIPPLCCEGEVYRPAAGDPVVKHPGIAGGVVTIPVSTTPTPVTLTLESSTAGAVTFGLSDFNGVLVFAPSSVTSSAGASRFFTSTISLGAGEVRSVTVNAWRIDSGGAGSPDWTNILASAVMGPVLLEGTMPDSVFPALLPHTSGGSGGTTPRFAIVHIALTPPPSAQVVLSVPTQVGKTYQVQQSPNMTIDDWTDRACASIDTVVNPDGTFNGNGGIVNCSVPCVVSATRMFYRVAEVSP